jgi:hypothetical protein
MRSIIDGIKLAVAVVVLVLVVSFITTCTMAVMSVIMHNTPNGVESVEK